MVAGIVSDSIVPLITPGGIVGRSDSVPAEIYAPIIFPNAKPSVHVRMVEKKGGIARTVHCSHVCCDPIVGGSMRSVFQRGGNSFIRSSGSVIIIPRDDGGDIRLIGESNSLELASEVRKILVTIRKRKTRSVPTTVESPGSHRGTAR